MQRIAQVWVVHFNRSLIHWVWKAFEQMMSEPWTWQCKELQVNCRIPVVLQLAAMSLRAFRRAPFSCSVVLLHPGGEKKALRRGLRSQARRWRNIAVNRTVLWSCEGCELCDLWMWQVESRAMLYNYTQGFCHCTLSSIRWVWNCLHSWWLGLPFATFYSQFDRKKPGFVCPGSSCCLLWTTFVSFLHVLCCFAALAQHLRILMNGTVTGLLGHDQRHGFRHGAFLAWWGRCVRVKSWEGGLETGNGSLKIRAIFRDPFPFHS